MAQVKRLQTDLDEEENDRTLVAALDTAQVGPGRDTWRREPVRPGARHSTLSGGLSNLQLAGGSRRPRGRGGAGFGSGQPRCARALLAALDEWDDLAGNPLYQIHEPHREWLRAVLEAAESGDGWGQQVRTARRESDVAKRRAALEALAATADVRNDTGPGADQTGQQTQPGPKSRTAAAGPGTIPGRLLDQS